MTYLESAFISHRPRAFLAGTSCNLSGSPSITSGQEAVAAFGHEPRVAGIVRDNDFDEGRGLFSGSHTMLRIVGNCIVPQRAGSVHTDSFKPLFKERLSVPSEFRNASNATVVDIPTVSKNGHYLR